MFEQFSIQEIYRQIQSNEKTIEEISLHVPCYLHINSLEDFSILEADSKLLSYFEMDIEEVNKLGFNYLQKIVQKDDLIHAIDVNLDYIKHQDSKTHVSFFQRVTYTPQKKEQIYYTRGKILDQNRILNLSVPVHDLELFNQRVTDIYENVHFIKANLDKFNLLTKKEIEVCKYLCAGNSLQEVADVMNISVHTIKNHKINIYKKMEVNNFFRFYNFAVKFKLDK